MTNLLIILLAVFAGVALMVVIGQRHAKPLSAEKQARLARWIMPLVGLVLVLSLLKYYF